jgi:hypothetical protein
VFSLHAFASTSLPTTVGLWLVLGGYRLPALLQMMGDFYMIGGQSLAK